MTINRLESAPKQNYCEPENAAQKEGNHLVWILVRAESELDFRPSVSSSCKDYYKNTKNIFLSYLPLSCCAVEIARWQSVFSSLVHEIDKNRHFKLSFRSFFAVQHFPVLKMRVFQKFCCYEKPFKKVVRRAKRRTKNQLIFIKNIFLR